MRHCVRRFTPPLASSRQIESYHFPVNKPPHSPRIAIIGGGISGLAAAHQLLELLPQVELSLFEATNRLGGVLETIERDGFLIERSADNFLTAPPTALELCRRLGMENDLVPTDEFRRQAFVVRKGRLVPIPDGFYLMSPRKLMPILRSPLLSLRGKLRLLIEPLVLRGPIASRNSDLQTDESVASFARRRLGREVFETFVQPLIAGIYTADPEKLSMAATMPQFVEFERTHSSLLRATLRRTYGDSSASGARYGLFLAPKHGLQSLVTKLADRIPADAIQLNTKVTQVTQRDNHWQLAFNPQSAIRNPKSEFDALVLAVPAHAGANLLASVNSQLAAELAKIEYAGCAVVSLGFHRRQIGHPLNGFGFVVPETERRRIIAGSFASLKYSGRAPAKDVLIRVFIGGALQPELLDLPDADLRRIAQDELAELLQITGMPLIADVARWPRSMPQYHVGHLSRVARIDQLAAAYQTLALAGNAYRGVGIPQCIASGEAAAQRIALAF
jgi:protoporphyrinogen/coproporphyrinogen III oxidase